MRHLEFCEEEKKDQLAQYTLMNGHLEVTMTDMSVRIGHIFDNEMVVEVDVQSHELFNFRTGKPLTNKEVNQLFEITFHIN